MTTRKTNKPKFGQGKTMYYTIEKLPTHKGWSLNRLTEPNHLTPIAFFKKESEAIRTKKELAK